MNCVMCDIAQGLDTPLPLPNTSYSPSDGRLPLPMAVLTKLRKPGYIAWQSRPQTVTIMWKVFPGVSGQNSLE